MLQITFHTKKASFWHKHDFLWGYINIESLSSLWDKAVMHNLSHITSHTQKLDNIIPYIYIEIKTQSTESRGFIKTYYTA